MIQPQIVAKPELKVIGFETPFISVLSPDATNFQVIGPLWERLIHHASRIPNRIGNEMYGVVSSRPEAERSHPHELRYLAAVAVSSNAELPDGMVFRAIPAGTFAVFTHRGPIHTIGNTVKAIYSEWLPQSGYQHTGIADIELYDHRFDCGSSHSEMEYWIPLTSKRPLN